MANSTRNIKVSNTNGNSNNKMSYVRIYKNGNMVAEVEINKRNPLAYLQSIVNGSKFLVDMSEQLQSHLNSEYNTGGDLTLEDFQYLQTEWNLKVHIC